MPLMNSVKQLSRNYHPRDSGYHSLSPGKIHDIFKCRQALGERMPLY